LGQPGDYKEWVFNCQAIKLMNTIQQNTLKIRPRLPFKKVAIWIAWLTA
jgi:hypothetical protein